MRIRRMARYLSVLLAFTLVAAGGACSQRDDDDDDTSAGGGDSAASSDIPTEDCVADPTEIGRAHV